MPRASKRASDTRAPAGTNAPADTNVPADTDETEYRAAVEEGKVATADISLKQWVLGDLALKVEKRYGENRLKQFAEDINFPGNHWNATAPSVAHSPKTGAGPGFSPRHRCSKSTPIAAKSSQQTPTSAKPRRAKSCGSGAQQTRAQQHHQSQRLRKTTTCWRRRTPNQRREQPPRLQRRQRPKAKGPKKTANAAQADEWLRDTIGWINKSIVHANAVTTDAGAKASVSLGYGAGLGGGGIRENR